MLTTKRSSRAITLARDSVASTIPGWPCCVSMDGESVNVFLHNIVRRTEQGGEARDCSVDSGHVRHSPGIIRTQSARAIAANVIW